MAIPRKWLISAAILGAALWYFGSARDTTLHANILRSQIVEVMRRDQNETLDPGNILLVKYWHARRVWVVTADKRDIVVRADCNYPLASCFAVLMVRRY